MSAKRGQNPSTTKRIRTYWCGFCRKKVTFGDANNVHLGKRRWSHLCPTCGGVLLGNNPGISRDIFRG